MGRSALVVTGMTLMLTFGVGIGAGVRTASAQTCGGGTVQVNSTADADDGTCGAHCTLREAINAANASVDCTRITFDFSPAPNGVIVVSSPLPLITTPVHFLGWSHPGSARIGPEGEEPDFRVTIRGANNIAGAALRFMDAGGSLVEGLAIDSFTSGAAIEIVASTNADQNITIRENVLAIWKTTATNRVGISVQARGIHIGGFEGTSLPGAPLPPMQLPDPVDWRAGNIIIGTTGPAIHVTTSPNGIQGQARILGNHLFYWSFFNTPFAVDLGPEGRTPNDPGDADAGPNDLQNFPEVRFEAIRVAPLDENDIPCGPTGGLEPYEDCDAVRITATLRDAPAGTYTAELHAGFLGDVDIDDGQPPRFRAMGTRTVTGAGDIVFIFELPLSSSGSARTLIEYLKGDFQAGDPGVYVSVSQGTVSTFAGPTSEWSEGGTAGGGPGPQPSTFSRYFAEGATGSFFSTTFSLSNFGTTAGTATLSFDTDAGQTVTHTVDVPAGGRPVTIPVDAIAGVENASFGTRITANVPLVSSRTMTWDATGYGSHADNGVAAPRTRWFLAEGVTGAFDTYVLVYNPAATDANITMTFSRIAPLPPIARDYTVPAHGRLTVLVDGVDPELAATDVAIDISSTNGIPIVVERSVYLSSATTLYEAGTGTSASDVGTAWYFGEGAALGTFDTYLLLFNPNTTAAAVDVRYLRAAGGPVVASYVVQPQSRLSIATDAIPALDGQEFGMVVTSTNGVPVAAERAMWGGGQAFIDGHASPGIGTPSIRWGLNGGEASTSAGADTYILIVNPTATDTTARITLFFENGTSSPARTFDVPAERRVNVSVASMFPEADNTRFSMLVESIGAGTPALVVERSTYTSPGLVWRASSNEPGTPLP
jgi:CSLREA domain-containing protein